MSNESANRKTARQEREERLAAQLRENLKKRKMQARARRTDVTQTPSGEE